MATINRGILGGFKGRVANVVGSSWKGIATMRSLPLSVTNPKTAGQVSNRTRFGSLSILAADCLTTIVKPLNDRFAQQMSGYNMFTQRSKNAFTGEGVFVPEELIISSGKLGDAMITLALVAFDSPITINFPQAPTGAYESAADKAYVLAVDSKGLVVGTSSGVVARSVGSLSVTPLRGLETGETINLYLAFLRADGTMVGNRAFAQEIVISV